MHEALFAPDVIAGHVAKVQALRPMADRLGISLAQLALAWAIHQPGVTGVISRRGQQGVRAFAAQHAESDGRKPSVEMRDVAERDGGYWLASLHLASTEVATGDTLYEFDVGGVFRLEGGLIARVEAFASPHEAEAAPNPQSR